ncbi:MAG: FliM/FliN family flagellar motor switch protein [Acidobacteriota bacterium]
MPDDDALLLPSMGDIKCEVAVRLGSTVISVRECLSLQPRSIVRLAQPVGDDVEVRVHGSVIARGEVEIIDNKSSIRLTSLAPFPSGEVRR